MRKKIGKAAMLAVFAYIKAHDQCVKDFDDPEKWSKGFNEVQAMLAVLENYFSSAEIDGLISNENGIIDTLKQLGSKAA